jgi:hypothetical protein
MHVHAEPVAGAVHVELLVRAALEDGIERAVAQPEVDEALRQHALGDLVIVVELRARTHASRHASCAASTTRTRTLRSVEAAVDGKRARDVGRVTLELAARVDEQQIAVLHQAVVLAIVEDARIGAGGHDRCIRNRLRAVLEEFVRELGSIWYSYWPGRAAAMARR